MTNKRKQTVFDRVKQVKELYRLSDEHLAEFLTLTDCDNYLNHGRILDYMSILGLCAGLNVSSQWLMFNEGGMLSAGKLNKIVLPRTHELIVFRAK